MESSQFATCSSRSAVALFAISCSIGLIASALVVFWPCLPSPRLAFQFSAVMISLLNEGSGHHYDAVVCHREIASACPLQLCGRLVNGKARFLLRLKENET